MEYHLKKLTTTDRDLLRQLLECWYHDEPERLAHLPSTHYLRDLLNRPDLHLYVALLADQVVGGLSAHELPLLEREKREMFLYEMEVHPEHRRRGLGRRLIEALQQTCSERNIEVIYLGTELDNEAAQQLYCSTGGQRELIAWYTYPKNTTP